MTGAAATRWAEDLQRWAIPEHLLRGAPEDPHRFSVERFSELAAEALRQPPTRTHERVRHALPAGGSVLDVGCGGGAASLPLVPPAGHLVGVDQSAGMLAAFTRAAAERGAITETVEGVWPA
jgi:SAM-dependent methyltransferase